MYIKCLELTNFKSFGGTTEIPLLPGFTVVSGPNGSGKSNLIDALLFCLGLAGSKGMRAERLPDLVNHTQSSRNRSTIEASVTVTFDLGDEIALLNQAAEFSNDNGGPANGHRPNDNDPAPDSNGNDATANGDQAPILAVSPEWRVTRKLRVTQQGTYTSNYYVNGLPCTLTELHEQLNRLRIYPEGYNVVLQGDVTRIISMNSRERREIIDELAGVAAFDRKIDQAREKLDAVKDHEDKYHIVEKELIDQRDRLSQDRVKAEKYQKLRQELHTKEQWQVVLRYRKAMAALEALQAQILQGDRGLAESVEQLATLATAIQQETTELAELNDRVKAMGEEEQLALQATLATREAELRHLQRQEQELQVARRSLEDHLTKLQQELQAHLQAQDALAAEAQHLETETLTGYRQRRDQACQQLEALRQAANNSAAQAEAWVQEHTALRNQLEADLSQLEPQRTEQAQLQERATHLDRLVQEQAETLQTQAQQLETVQQQRAVATAQLAQQQDQVQILAAKLAGTEQELQIQQETQTRLSQEQRQKQRRLDQLEAQVQAMQEAQGTHATQVILQLGLSGVCGLVAQLGKVDPRYQLALEVAAGARLGHLVVEDDATAAAGIEILKQRKAGRATFLPLNKMQPGRLPRDSVRSLPGCVDYAIHLIEYEPKYQDVFTYVFGTTVVFATLADARRHLGQYRIVTLEGELLESSGAMTGGSLSQRSTLHFGTVDTSESAEVRELRARLQEIEQVLSHCIAKIEQATQLTKQQSQELIEARQQYREQQLQVERLEAESARLETSCNQLSPLLEQNRQELATAQTRRQQLDATLPALDQEVTHLRQALAQLEQAQAHSEWHQIQSALRNQEAELSQRELDLRALEQRLQDLTNQKLRAQEKIQTGQTQLQEIRTQQAGQLNQLVSLSDQQDRLQTQIDQTKEALAVLEQRLGSAKQTRDRAEHQLREHQHQKQQLEWQQQKLQETQQARREQLVALEQQLTQQQQELPNPLPELPPEVEARELGELEHEIRSLHKRIQAMEPVNMLALEEYERTQARLGELTDRLKTLEQERTELLLRIENFTTLRQRAFKEAFDAVNQNFQTIFATLSEGDGYLQLDDSQDPFNGGLNLVAHPKGKPVQRLASMSGGEKSLTALSFIFALQRYRPSPFYAFDEVDMFLDGANVERLARMIKQQAQQAQFIVVSLRRPMIESAQRTIGVTQARGAYTQVLGIDLTPQRASS